MLNESDAAHLATLLAQYARYAELRRQLDELSDAMTFATPAVWMAYKAAAYAGTPDAIATLGDLREHCGSDGICSRRFSYLSSFLAGRGIDLGDIRRFPDGLPLLSLMEEIGVGALGEDGAFMEGWNAHEYYRSGGRAAKWGNYSS